MTIAPIELYGLGLEHGQDINVGPYAWKTAVDLGVLGVPYTWVGRTFEEIRTTFETETGNPKVTVPALKIDDKWVSDSFVVAEALEKKYGTPERSLFGGSPEGLAFARFINVWADKDLGLEIVPLFAPWLYQAQTPESSKWFLKQKLGGDQDKINFLINAVKDPKFVETQVAVVRNKLATIEQYLAESKAKGKGQFIAGTDYPTHADAAVYGWYVATVAIRPAELDLVNRIWKHESLPLVSQWIGAVEKASGAKPEFPY